MTNQRTPKSLTNMISLKAPKITASDRKTLTIHQERLTQVINAAESGCKAVIDLRKKSRKLEKERDDLNQGAANFDRDAEMKLSATLRQIERIHDAIHQAESQVHEWKNPLFRALDDGRAEIARICQTTYEELLDRQAVALAPFWESWAFARQVGKNSTAVNALVRRLLSHSVGEFDAIELIDQRAREVLADINAILDGAVVWEFEGAAVPESTAVAV
jgi:MarR-like DNA-binding transcriptional regulator SgrR of sgrS sRNA